MSGLPQSYQPLNLGNVQVVTADNQLEWHQFQSGYRALFKHLDNRIWQAVISKTGADWSLALTSAGCRPYNFFAPSVGKVRNTANYFAHLGRELYCRLVADARPTQAHPDTGVSVVVLAMPLDTQAATARHDRALTYMGKVNTDNTITLYPSNQELNDLLYYIGDAGGSVPVLDNTLQEVSVESVQEQLQRTNVYSALETAAADLTKHLFAGKPARRVISL